MYKYLEGTILLPKHFIVLKNTNNQFRDIKFQFLEKKWPRDFDQNVRDFEWTVWDFDQDVRYFNGNIWVFDQKVPDFDPKLLTFYKNSSHFDQNARMLPKSLRFRPKC